MFKNIDQKFKDIGFIKVKENPFEVVYERHNNTYAYTHVLTIAHKASGKHIVQSYDKSDYTLLGNTCVGLTGYEMKLVLEKMKKIGWYSK